MTQKKTSPKAASTIDVGGLPGFQHAQISEAMQTEHTFTMRSGARFTFKAQQDWSYNAEQAAVRGDIPTWVHGALKDPSKADALLDDSATDIGRILQYYIDESGVSRGEDSSSSNS